MTLLFARDIRGQKGHRPDSYPSAKVLVPVIQPIRRPGTTAKVDSVSRSGAVRWLAPWLGVTATAAVVMTAFDAALLHRRQAYFTGGFLSVDYVTTWQQGAAFFASSLISDAAILGVFIAIVLRVCSRLDLSKRDSVVLAFMVSLAPVVTADFLAVSPAVVPRRRVRLRPDVQPGRARSGRDPGRVLPAGAWRHRRAGGWDVALFAGVVWMLHRNRRRLRALSLPSRKQAAFGCAVLLVVGSVATTAFRRGSDVLDNGLRRKPTGQLLGALVNLVSDVDRDGYGLLGRRQDPAPLNASVHPFALDVPGNGVDEDAVAGDLPAGRRAVS